jgi:glutaconate CoA-transferase subunit B
MLTAAAGFLGNNETVLVGVGMPGQAATLAQGSHAPELTLVYESGAIGSRPARPPLSIGDPTLFAGALQSLSVADVFTFLIEGGRIDTAFVGAAEIDRLGRLNSTVIGPYESPKVRLPGSGGACEIVQYAKRSLLLSPLQERRFPAEVNFVTSAPPERAEILIVTDQCVLRRAPGGDEVELWRLYEGVEVADVDAVVGWSLRTSPELERMEVGGGIDD